MKISIVILTKNAGNLLSSVLDGIYSQSVLATEVIIIDSTSTDNTIDIAKKYPVKLVKIKPEDFGHGKTRNLGTRMAKGDVVVFLTQDAVPNNTNWLREITKPLSNPKIAGVYGRQIPRINENIIDKYFYLSLYSNKDIHRTHTNSNQVDTIFSDVNSAIKKEILIKVPFNNNIIVTEDHEWANRVLKKGYEIFYSSKATVTHSHSYSLKSTFKRHFDIGVSYNQIQRTNTFFGFIKKGIQINIKEIVFLSKNGYFYLIPYCLLKDLVKFVALTAGKKEKYIPRKLKVNFSNYKNYWI